MGLFLNADLLLLPYNAAGGYSAVLDQAMFFDLPTVAIDFPEYIEQSEGASFVKVCAPQEFYEATREVLERGKKVRKINVNQKLKEAERNMADLLMRGNITVIFIFRLSTLRKQFTVP